MGGLPDFASVAHDSQRPKVPRSWVPTLPQPATPRSGRTVRHSSLGVTTGHFSLSLAERLSNYQENRRELEKLQREDEQFKHLWSSTSIARLRRRPEMLKPPTGVRSDGSQTVCGTTSSRTLKTFFRTLATEPKLREEKDVRSLAEWTRGVDIFYGLTLPQVREDIERTAKLFELDFHLHSALGLHAAHGRLSLCRMAPLCSTEGLGASGRRTRELDTSDPFRSLCHVPRQK